MSLAQNTITLTAQAHIEGGKPSDREYRYDFVIEQPTCTLNADPIPCRGSIATTSKDLTIDLPP